MTTLLRRLPGPRCSSRRWLSVILRETHGQTSHPIPRNRARLLTGGGRPLTACSRAHNRGQHTEAAEPVEVDLKRLDGEEDGRDTLTCDSTLFTYTLTNSPFFKHTFTA